jgi:flagellin-like protein
MKFFLKNKKALSPVVAAIILMAVTVAVSIAVAAWMGSLTSNSMEVNELTITNLDFTIGDSLTGKIVVQVTNTGTSDVTIQNIKVNSEQADTWSANTSSTVDIGTDEIFTITQLVELGKKYWVTLHTNDGTLVGSYTDTA